MPQRPADQRFRRRERLSRRRDFALVYAARRRKENDLLVVYVQDNTLACSRLGISVSRRVGKAVLRNRLRRRLRETYRTHKRDVPVGLDIVCVIKPPAAREPSRLCASLVPLILQAARKSPATRR